MITQNRQSLILAMGLAALAGFVDALGFIKLGGFFISFMSGNSTRFGVNFAEKHIPESLPVPLSGPVLLPLSLICLFVVGVIIATLIEHHAKRRKPLMVLGFVVAMLFCASVLNQIGIGFLAVACMVLAMGAENIVFVRKGEVTFGVTYMTGTLVKLGQKIAGMFMGQEARHAVPYLLMWLGLVSGAVIGALCYAAMGLTSLWIAFVFAVLIWAAAFKFLKELP